MHRKWLESKCASNKPSSETRYKRIRCLRIGSRGWHMSSKELRNWLISRRKRPENYWMRGTDTSDRSRTRYIWFIRGICKKNKNASRTWQSSRLPLKRKSATKVISRPWISEQGNKLSNVNKRAMRNASLTKASTLNLNETDLRKLEITKDNSYSTKSSHSKPCKNKSPNNTSKRRR